MPKEHTYDLSLTWTGNGGTGTTDYLAYGREHEISAGRKPLLLGSADPAFRGDPQRWNPEELLVASIAQCHMLWYLHLAADAKTNVVGYVDNPVGTMSEDGIRGGQFTEVLLQPTVTVETSEMATRALELHADVGAKCFIARSVNFPIRHRASVLVAEPG